MKKHKKYLVEWYTNGWHNGIFEAIGFKDLIEQLKSCNIHPQKITIVE